MIIPKKTKIIASVSDSQTAEQFQELYNAGVNVIRINFSHAKYEGAENIIKNVKKINASGKANLAILLDTKGPEIRTGEVEEKIVIKKGQKFLLKVLDPKAKPVKEKKDAKKGAETVIYCDYEFLTQDVKKDQIIIIDSGLLKGKVVSVGKDFVELTANNDHLIGSRRHVNLPGVKLRLPGMTEKDKEDIEFGIKHGIDFIAASFMRTAKNVEDIRNLLKKHKATHIQIISKIENQEALENLEEIVEASDGIMVARGDLGVETDVWTVPFHQEAMMDMCASYGKYIVVATEMLKSMVESPFPTRAEVSDVYNAAASGTDCTMLSEETAIGKNPAGTVSMMANILKEAESNTYHDHDQTDIVFVDDLDREKNAIARSALFVADDVEADAVILFTRSGFLSKVVSTYRPNQLVFGFTTDEQVYRGMNVLFGVHPFMLSKREKNPLDDENNAIALLKAEKLVKKGAKIVVINNIVTGSTTTPYVKVIHVS